MKSNSSITIENVLAHLHSCKLLLSVQYCQNTLCQLSSKNVFLFLEAAMMQRTREAQKGFQSTNICKNLNNILTIN